MKPSKRQPPFGLRLPPELKSWLSVKARENRRSLNSECVVALERYRSQAQGEQRTS